MHIKLLRKVAALGLTAAMAMSFASCSRPKQTRETTEETQAQKVEETETTTEETTAEETAETTEAEYTGEEYMPFIEDLIQTMKDGKRMYEGSDNVKVTGSMDTAYKKGFSYIFTDVDNDGKHELLIGCEGTSATGERFIAVDAFVVIGDAGTYNILVSGWERIHPDYIGNGHIIVGMSAAANCMISTLYHYDSATCSMVVDAQYHIDSTEEPDEIPELYYTLYEGRESDFGGPAINDPAEDVLHGEDATARWKEIQVEIAPNGNELMGAEWIKVEI